MVTRNLGSDKVGTSREAGLAIRSGKSRIRTRGAELLEVVRVEVGRGKHIRARQGPALAET